jgi:hypothetical protein
MTRQNAYTNKTMREIFSKLIQPLDEPAFAGTKIIHGSSPVPFVGGIMATALQIVPRNFPNVERVADSRKKSAISVTRDDVVPSAEPVPRCYGLTAASAGPSAAAAHLAYISPDGCKPSSAIRSVMARVSGVMSM